MSSDAADGCDVDGSPITQPSFATRKAILVGDARVLVNAEQDDLLHQLPQVVDHVDPRVGARGMADEEVHFVVVHELAVNVGDDVLRLDSRDEQRFFA